MTHAEVISAIGPTRLSRELNLPIKRVAKWRERSSIPAYAWLDVIEVARGAKIRGVTVQRLAIAAAKRGMD